MGVTKLKKFCEVTMTATTKGPGTYPYMAPEMFRKARRGPAVDIYSLGALFLELFGCRRVWPGLELAEIMLKVCGSPPEMPDMTHLDSTTFHGYSMIRQTYNFSMYSRLITDSNYNYYNNVDCVMALLARTRCRQIDFALSMVMSVAAILKSSTEIVAAAASSSGGNSGGGYLAYSR